MVRDVRRLADTRFDVLVIGAGIYGVATAWDAAQRGLSVALIDRGDIGGGTSFHNLKTLHGGLRSLQAMNVRQMRRFIRERYASNSSSRVMLTRTGVAPPLLTVGDVGDRLTVKSGRGGRMVSW